MITVDPWNRSRAEMLAQRANDLPHAILFSGPAGLGKSVLVEWLSRVLLCDSAGQGIEPCGHCQSCRLWPAGSHPDLHVVLPENTDTDSESLMPRYAQRYWPGDKTKETRASSAIRIDQIRAVIDVVSGRPQISDRRVIIVMPAERMNINSANALLKLLEEPPPDTQFLLASDRPARLPATIRSRCVRFDFSPIAREQALPWLAEQGVPAAAAAELLAMSGGAPRRALNLYRADFLTVREDLIAELEAMLMAKADPVSCAGRWKERGADACLGWFQGWLADLVAQGAGPARNPGLQSRLQDLKKRLNLRQLFEFSDVVTQARGQLGGSVDELLTLEDTLVRWTNLTIPAAAQK